MRFYLALLGTLLAPLLSGCMTVAPSLTESASPQTQILAALQRSADAWNAGDLKGHVSIYDESVTVMTKSGPRPTIEAIEKSFTAAYFKDGKPLQTLGFSHAAVRMLSQDSALVTGQFTLSGSGRPDQTGWFTLVWLRTPSGWRAVHDHTS